ncbi:microphthalmia-associated transcription factor-like isoform X2 [Liolophura sinensis]|uniref:microphthalmia-associated transcription factor-like isoform X2 n=1 Tax=Liolophura sinensis TaxID=3198878 RepID=UPI003158E78C
MQDSGISLDLDSLLSEVNSPFDNTNFYQLKSTVIPGSPATEFKHATMTSRTGLKLQLMKQQVQDEEKKEALTSQSLRLSGLGGANSFHTTPVSMPVSSSVNSDVPPQILQVKTRLQNPTKYHVEQSQKRQIQMFISQSQPEGPLTHSLSTINLGHISNSYNHQHPNSAPVDPDSPLSVGMSSAATSMSEVDDILGEIISLENVDATTDNDLNFIEPTLSHISSSTEAPTFLSDDEARLWAKERQKKDNHNLIERRRRFNINDRIKELGTLLPKCSDPDMRQNKGTILKASVDYIRRLKRDHDKMKQLEEKQRMMEATNRRMMLRIQQLELLMKAHGITTGTSNDSEQLLTTLIEPNTLQTPLRTMNTDIVDHTQAAIASLTQLPHSQSPFDDMDDTSPVGGDPMMLSAPVSPAMEEENSDLLNL